MVTIEKTDDNWPAKITLLEVPEGLAEITNIIYPTIPPSIGDQVNITATVKNVGDDDTIFCKLVDEDTGGTLDSQSQIMTSGAITDFYFNFTMPSKILNLAIQAGHEAVPRVIFRQSWLPANNPSGSNWIAVDTNNDGILEGWNSVSSFGSSAPPTEFYGFYLISYDPLGRAVYLKSNKVYIYRGYNANLRSYSYWEFDNSSAIAVTSSEPVEPYASNGQETWETD